MAQYYLSLDRINTPQQQNTNRSIT